MKPSSNKFLGYALLVLTSCASSPTVTDTSSTIIDAKANEQFKFSKTSAKMRALSANYKYMDKSQTVEAFFCDSGKDTPAVAVINDDQTGFAPDSACDNWQSQVILTSGYRPLMINRPSFGKSTGANDFAGPQSQAAVTGAIQSLGGGVKVAGIWGYGSGAICAGFVAKKIKDLSWLLLGNGFYDLEVTERQTKDTATADLIKKVKAAEGDVALERRSIAWDFSDLPKNILLYHSKSNDAAPKSQADAFNDQLRAAQTKTFYDEFDGSGHEIPWQAHFQIVEKALKSLKAR